MVQTHPPHLCSDAPHPSTSSLPAPLPISPSWTLGKVYLTSLSLVRKRGGEGAAVVPSSASPERSQRAWARPRPHNPLGLRKGPGGSPHAAPPAPGKPEHAPRPRARAMPLSRTQRVPASGDEGRGLAGLEADKRRPVCSSQREGHAWRNGRPRPRSASSLRPSLATARTAPHQCGTSVVCACANPDRSYPLLPGAPGHSRTVR